MGACRGPEDSVAAAGSASSAVAPGESAKWTAQRQLAAIVNNAGIAKRSCTTGNSVAAIMIFAETIPILFVIPTKA